MYEDFANGLSTSTSGGKGSSEEIAASFSFTDSKRLMISCTDLGAEKMLVIFWKRKLLMNPRLTTSLARIFLGTLSVGQLTTGVTIPEWTAVMMLSNVKSPALYMQTAFRAQNPYKFKENGQLFRKERAYVFDFDPSRTLLDFFSVTSSDSLCLPSPAAKTIL